MLPVELYNGQSEYNKMHTTSLMGYHLKVRRLNGPIYVFLKVSFTDIDDYNEMGFKTILIIKKKN